MNFMKIGSATVMHKGLTEFLSEICYILQNCVKFTICDPRSVLLVIRDFRKIQLRDGDFLVMGLNKLH